MAFRVMYARLRHERPVNDYITVFYLLEAPRSIVDKLRTICTEFSISHASSCRGRCDVVTVSDKLDSEVSKLNFPCYWNWSDAQFATTRWQIRKPIFPCHQQYRLSTNFPCHPFHRETSHDESWVINALDSDEAVLEPQKSFTRRRSETVQKLISYLRRMLEVVTRHSRRSTAFHLSIKLPIMFQPSALFCGLRKSSNQLTPFSIH